MIRLTREARRPVAGSDGPAKLPRVARSSSNFLTNYGQFSHDAFGQINPSEGRRTAVEASRRENKLGVVGNMGRTVAKLTSLTAGATAVTFLLAGCSAAAGNAVVGIPASAPPAYTQAGNTIDTNIDQAVQAELAAAGTIQSDAASSSVLVEINALTSGTALIRAEAFSALQRTGANEIAKREAIVSSLIGDVRNDAYLSGITFAGSSLSATLLSRLYGVDAQLQGLAGQIASDSLPYQLQSDVKSIGPSTRVAGLISPMTHLAIAGGDVLRVLNDLSREYQTLRSTATGGGSLRLADLSASIASARQIADSAIAAVMSLNVSGYPANKATVKQIHDALVQLRSPLGKLGEARADVLALLSH